MKSAYSTLIRTSDEGSSQRHHWKGFSLIWKSHAPLKAQISTWRLALDRLPTKFNLNKCINLAPKELFCCCCHQLSETSDHFFIHCAEVHRLWCEVADCIRVRWAPASSIHAHFEHFSELYGRGKVRKKIRGLWIYVIWVLWKWRNSVLFDHKEWIFARIEEEIKCCFWSWSAVRGDAPTILSFADSNCNFSSYFC